VAISPLVALVVPLFALLLSSCLLPIPESEKNQNEPIADVAEKRLANILVPPNHVFTTSRLVTVSMHGAMAETLRDARLSIFLPDGYQVFYGKALLVAKGVLKLGLSYSNKELVLKFTRDGEEIYATRAPISNDGKVVLEL